MERVLYAADSCDKLFSSLSPPSRRPGPPSSVFPREGAKASGAARRWTAGVLCMFGYPEHGASQKSLLLRYRGGAMTPTTVVVVACMCNQVLFHFLNFLPDGPHTDDERDGTRE